MKTKTNKINDSDKLVGQALYYIDVYTDYSAKEQKGSSKSDKKYIIFNKWNNETKVLDNLQVVDFAKQRGFKYKDGGKLEGWHYDENSLDSSLKEVQLWSELSMLTAQLPMADAKRGIREGRYYVISDQAVGFITNEFKNGGSAQPDFASEILRQLGGHQFMAMVGASHLAKDVKDKYISFKIGRNKSQANYVKIRLTPMDVYELSFIRVHGANVEDLKTFDMVYADMLQQIFTSYTGLATKLKHGGKIITTAKVLVISSENPLSKQLSTLTGDSYNAIDFEDLVPPSQGEPYVILHKSSGEVFIVFSLRYISQVDKNVVNDNLSYVQKTFGIDAFEWVNKPKFKNGGEASSRAEKIEKIKRYISQFPDKPKDWSESTDELPDLHNALAEDVAGYKGNVFISAGGTMPDDIKRNLKIRNKYHKKAIVELLTKLTDKQFNEFYTFYSDWFENINDEFKQGGVIEYGIFVHPKGEGFEPHFWTEGGTFANKSVAEEHAKSIRKMKDRYQKVEVLPIEKGGKTDKESVTYKMAKPTLNKKITLYMFFGSFIQDGSLFPPYSKFNNLWTSEKSKVEEVFKEAGLNSFSKEEIKKIKDYDGVFLFEIKKTQIPEETWKFRLSLAKESGYDDVNMFINDASDYDWDIVKERAINTDGSKVTKKELDGYLDTLYKSGGQTKTPEQIWNKWTPEQRDHFLYDHKSTNLKSEMRNLKLELHNKNYDDLPDEIKLELRTHLRMPKYKKGGQISDVMIDELSKYVESKGDNHTFDDLVAHAKTKYKLTNENAVLAAKKALHEE